MKRSKCTRPCIKAATSGSIHACYGGVAGAEPSAKELRRRAENRCGRGNKRQVRELKRLRRKAGGRRTKRHEKKLKAQEQQAERAKWGSSGAASEGRGIWGGGTPASPLFYPGRGP